MNSCLNPCWKNLTYEQALAELEELPAVGSRPPASWKKPWHYLSADSALAQRCTALLDQAELKVR